jgi:hypothetical protein
VTALQEVLRSLEFDPRTRVEFAALSLDQRLSFGTLLLLQLQITNNQPAEACQIGRWILTGYPAL